MSQSTGETNRITSQPLGTTSARLVAVKLKSANKNIFRALMSLGSANLVQRIMGLVNTTIVTARFGQGGEMDAYYIASILPLTLADLLSSAMEGSVIPVYARVRTKGSREKASRLYSTILNALLIGLVSLTAIMLIFRQPLVILFAPGVKGNELQLAAFLAIYAFPVLFFKIINSFLEALLNAEGQFGWPAYAGMLNPLVTAIFVLVGGGSAGVVMLCIGTIGGLLAELVIIIYRAYKADFKYKLVMDLSMPEVHTTAKTAIPSLAAGVISMASPLVDQIFASLLPTVGNIAALNNAQKLYSVPTGVILGAVGRAALPYLAAQAAIKDMKAFKNTFRLYLWAVTIATTVIAAGMAVLSYPMILVLLAHGKYTTADASVAAITLSGLVIGLPPMAVGWIASKAFSALVMPRITIYISIFSIIANAVFDAIFGRLWGIFGIALATSALYCCTMVILLVSLRAAIGKLDLLTPPKELLDLVRKFGNGQLFDQWSVWKEENLSFSLSYEARKQLMRILCILLTFAFGIGLVVYVDTSHQTVLLVPAIAFGLLIVLAWLRNP
ncbi:MAG TPA: lipid II flippase MurJ, partial [Ktedonobacteraceae bacterium]|nr:lipid II flippase MurJ [Ktedonobacteraceae bacterium]